MKIAPIADVKARLSAYIDDCAKGPVVVTRNGRPAAVMVSITDEDELERFVLAHTPRFRRMLDAAQKRLGRKRGLSHEEFWKLVE